MASVRLNGVTKRFGNVNAVEDLNLNIEDGSFFSIVGPSGCGKTTLMRMIAGLETPDCGEIEIDGNTVFRDRDWTNVHPGKRDVGLVFQNYALWPHMTIRDNIVFGLKVQRVPKREREEKLTSVMRDLHMANLADRYPNELSGGQQQRVALARELVTGSRTLLMDEPLSNLDARLRISMRTELKRLHSESNHTIIYVTHDQLEALSLSEKIAVMRDGLVEQIGTPDQVYFDPATYFVADFIGSAPINRIDTTVDGRDLVSGQLRFNPQAHGIETEELKEKREIIVGIRPESLSSSPKMHDWSVGCKVVATLPAGPTNFVELEVLENGRPSGVFLMLQDFSRQGFEIGGEVTVGAQTSAILLFDAQSGKRLSNSFERNHAVESVA